MADNKPILGAPIDPLHPLAPGLRISLAFNEGSGEPFDAAGQRTFPATYPAAWSNTEKGPARYATGGTSAVEIPAAAFGGFPSREFTLRVLFRARAWPGGFTALIDAPDRNFAAFFDASGTNDFGISTSPSLSLAAGAWWDLVLTRTAAQIASIAPGNVYLNGSLWGTFTNTVNATAGPLCFGRNSSGGGSNADADFALIQLWSGRALSAGEIALAAADPLGMYLKPSAVRFFGASAGGGGTTTLAPPGIAPAEVDGSPTITPGPASLSPPGIGTAEALGPESADAGAIPLQPPGIGPAEAAGSPAAAAGPATVAPPGIGTAESPGSPQAAPGPGSVAPPGIGAGEAAGVPISAPGPVIVAPPGIGTGEAMGSPDPSTPGTIAPAGIGTGESAGPPGLGAGPVLSPAPGIGTGEAAGAAAASAGPVPLAPAGVVSGEAAGVPAASGSSAPIPAACGWPPAGRFFAMRRRRLGPRRPTRFATDPAYLAGLYATAAVEVDRNADGATTDALGGPWLDYGPVDGLEAIRVRVCVDPKGSNSVDRDDREGAETRVYVLLDRDAPLDRRNRLVVQAPDGTTRYLYPVGRSQDFADRRGNYHHSSCRAIEYPL